MRKMALILTLALPFVQCTSVPTIGGNLKGRSDFIGIQFGETKEAVRKELGQPIDTTRENLAQDSFEVWQYKISTSLLGSLTFNSEGHLIGRTIEYLAPPFEELTQFIHTHYVNTKFMRLIPCTARGSEEVLVGEAQGAFISAREGRVMVESWANPQLTRLRINSFYSKCPRLQPARVNP